MYDLVAIGLGLLGLLIFNFAPDINRPFQELDESLLMGLFHLDLRDRVSLYGSPNFNETAGNR